MIAAAGLILVLAAAGFAVRLVAGPTLADRIIAVDGILVVGCGAIALEALHSGDGEYLPTIVVITLIAFVGTAVAARFIEAQDDAGGSIDDQAPSSGSPS